MNRFIYGDSSRVQICIPDLPLVNFDAHIQTESLTVGARVREQGSVQFLEH